MITSALLFLFLVSKNHFRLIETFADLVEENGKKMKQVDKFRRT